MLSIMIKVIMCRYFRCFFFLHKWHTRWRSFGGGLPTGFDHVNFNGSHLKLKQPETGPTLTGDPDDFRILPFSIDNSILKFYIIYYMRKQHQPRVDRVGNQLAAAQSSALPRRDKLTITELNGTINSSSCDRKLRSASEGHN